MTDAPALQHFEFWIKTSLGNEIIDAYGTDAEDAARSLRGYRWCANVSPRDLVKTKQGEAA